ncbi:unnamed protein product [Brassica oleracea]
MRVLMEAEEAQEEEVEVEVVERKSLLGYIKYKGVASFTTKPPSFKGHYSTSFSFSLPGAVTLITTTFFASLSMSLNIVAIVMVSSSPPWSPVSSSHRLAPSSPSRARSVVTVSSSLHRHRLELAPSSTVSISLCHHHSRR